MTICSVLSKKPEDFNDSQTDSLLLGLPEEILIKISLWVTTGPRGMRDIHQWGQVCFLTHTLFHSENIQQIIQKDAVLELFWTKIPAYCGFVETIDQFGESFGGGRPVKAFGIRCWFEDIRTARQRHQITELYLRNLALKTLPPELGRLPELSSIDLSGNELEMIPSALGLCPNLTKVILNDNKITKIPSWLKEKCPQLSWVQLLRNPVSEKGDEAIPLNLKDVVELQ